MKTTVTATVCFLAIASYASAGPVQSRSCPFSCRTEGIPKQHCRDWREGNTCFIEDNRPGARAYAPIAGSSAGLSGDCQRGLGDLPEPRVEISDVRRTGNEFDDKIKIRGSVEGACLTEAGLFERGRRAEEIPVTGTREFRRYEFEVTTHRDDDPEIRVYNAQGERDILPLNDLERDRTRARYNPDAGFLGDFADRLSGR